MKTSLLIAGCVVLGLGFGIGLAMSQFGISSGYDNQRAVGTATPNEHPPQAYVENPTYDFGSMEVDTTLQHTFVIENRGGSDLLLRSGGTTCKCTMSELDEERVPPGESTEIKLEWKAQTSGPRFRQTATIITNDAHNGEITLTVEGDVRFSMQAYPQGEIVFATLHAHEEAQQEVDLYASLMEGLEVTGYTLSRPELSEYLAISYVPLPADQLDPEKGKSAVRITIAITPEQQLGNFRTVLTLETNHPERPQFDLVLRGNVDRGITIFGKDWLEKYELLDMRTVPRASGASHELTIWLRGPARENARLEVVSCEPEFVEATLGTPEPTSNGSAVRVPLQIVIPPNTEPTIRLGNDGGGYGNVVIDTHDEELGQIRIPLRFAVK
ncbi:MAG: DUF1573 domain-containing protein [Pirellulales bacterium]|nr:DUF1573 domain-containing protein [Planctomycetales bacterium]